ncbi:siroheme synthase [Thalassotalea sp. LPB0316]|uniref:siroheme synthase n=1 Tax=Thalassotalea sp. LPB0316 TaxID=2769490 RepID=UPI0018685F71|nr:NAD(P)-dependent oxidoreductase [Thalassotalea sp. LPB0316]QOL26163.1 siroheme synthase [Thalassotalea sp. LPB0316]
MRYFPVFLTADRLNIIIIGGGEVAARKIELMLKCTTNITVVAKHCNDTVARLINTEQLTWVSENYRLGLMNECNIAIAATDDEAINALVYEEAKSLGILANVVDQPDLCDYITPSIIDRDPMIVAISSSGSSPVLVRMLREQIEKTLPQAYGKLADFGLKFRDHVKARVKGVRNRRLFWEQIFQGEIGEKILNGQSQSAELAFITKLKENQADNTGSITFIHTKEGNPDNLTLKAHRTLQFADAVFYDETVNPEFIEYVRRDAEKFYQAIPSSTIINFQHALELAEAGQKVIYLLSGHQQLPRNLAYQSSDINKLELVNGE